MFRASEKAIAGAPDAAPRDLERCFLWSKHQR